MSAPANLLTQKDLMARWGFNSIRSVQRARARFKLMPVDFWANQPLFAPADVARMEENRKKHIAEELQRAAKVCRKKICSKLVSLKEARRRAGRKARK